MMGSCQAFEADSPYVTSLTTFIDCQVRLIGQDGYAALAASSSPVAMAIGGMITILVALFGYRLILDDDVQIRDGVVLVVRIGIVLAFATQWPAYQSVAYDVAIDGPNELSSTILGTDAAVVGGLPERIQQSYDALEALAHPQLGLAVSGAAQQRSESAPTPPQRFVRLTGTEQGRLSASSVILLLSSLAALLSVRIVAGLMLALGPLFLACLLFDSLRGLFEGWVRVLAGAALGSIATAIVLALELAILEPQLRRLLDAIAVQQMPPTGVVEVFVTTLLFGVTLFIALGAAARAAAGFRIPASISRSMKAIHSSWTRAVQRQTRHSTDREREASIHLSRNERSAPSGHPQQTSGGIDPGRRIVLHQREAESSGPGSSPNASFEPLGRMHSPRLASRRSASATRRDRRA